MDPSTLTSPPSVPASGRRVSFLTGFQFLRPVRWFRRHLGKILFWGITLVTLAWQYENWHGRRFLAQQHAQWAAEYGDITRLPETLPSTTDEANFFAAPVFETFVIKRTPFFPSDDPAQVAYSQKVHNLTEALPHARFLQMAFPAMGMPPGIVKEKVITPHLSLPDFGAWAQAQEKAGLIRPAGLSDAAWFDSLMPEDPTLDGLIAALARPESQFLPSAEALSSIGEAMDDPAAVPIPASSGSFTCSQRLALRAQSAAAAGKGRTARDLCEVLLRFAEGPARSKSLVMVLVGLALEGEALRAIKAGIDAQCWSENDLLHLADRLERLDEEKLVRRGLYSDALWVHRMPIEKTRAWFRRITHFPNVENVGALYNFIVAHGPAGWIDSNLANNLKQWATILTPDAPGDDLKHLNDKMNQGLKKMQIWNESALTPRNFFTRILMSNVSGISRHALGKQTLRRQLLLALAVERYLLQYKSFPSQINQLVPRFCAAIPGDPWAPGTPLRYQTGENGERYRLISEGPETVLAFPTGLP